MIDMSRVRGSNDMREIGNGKNLMINKGKIFEEPEKLF